MFGDKWKSKDYPDGCVDCPEHEKLKNRHGGRGRCSKHYQRLLKAEKTLVNAAEEQHSRDLDGTADEHLLPGNPPLVLGVCDEDAPDPFGGARPVEPGPDVDPDPAPHPSHYRPDDDGANRFRVDTQAHAARHEVDESEADPDIELDQHGSQTIINNHFHPGPRGHEKLTPLEDVMADDTEPLKCCERKDDPGDDCGGPDCLHSDLFAERDARAGCCQGEPTNAEEPVDQMLMRHHAEALAEHVDVVAGIERTLAVYLDLIDHGRRTSRLVAQAAAALGVLGIGVELAPATIPFGHEPDAEVAAMERLHLALRDLERDAQIRAVRWVTARLEIDRPLPTPAASDLDGML